MTGPTGTTRPTDKAVHAWSLDGTLGHPRVPGPDGSGSPTRADGALDLLDLPAELARRGYVAVQLAHFQLPTRDASYLEELRSSLESSGIVLDAFLVDDGDLVHPADADLHERWISDRLDDALALGAHHARVGAGRSAPTPELIAASARRLSRLADGHPGVQVVVENWREMMPDADSVLALLADAGDIRLLIDLGNWTMPDKHEQLARIAPHAVTCHAKAHRHEDGRLDDVDYARSLRVLQDAGFAGALAMVNESSRPDGSDEWDGLEQEHEVVRRVFG
ncbi:sugar phosphate isomerase/epimerase family protein [Clavibacter capsici]|uniref:Sugar phosphate isomerase/epimerase n=1 Tax=Clavibacter capsici TaxID=1874630 RepID=A0AAE6XSH3_9MICO|nr:TIM barrel protein [Clavibacter capsici]ALD13686.1 sugar phosphate isomerase [Clavibacter capsici]QIS45904.1 sugar phosphate isomerase/epimerase [Clavibacter capsici]